MSANPFAPPPTDDLLDLWSETQRAERLHPQKPIIKNATLPSKREQRASIHGSELYTLPEYWEPRRGIALIHEESRSLIGNFQEYIHRRVAGCRKLVRTDEPVAITHTEYISGWEHIGEALKMQFEPQVDTEIREVLHPDLILGPLGVHASTVVVRVHLAYGGMTRCELAEPTRFSSLDGRTILTLAGGINVLEVMSIEAKLALRKELAE